MLYIMMVDPPRVIGWHVGEGRMTPSLLNVKGVVEVQADGDELDYIRANFKKLPDRPKESLINWFGDHAKFIASNL